MPVRFPTRPTMQGAHGVPARGEPLRAKTCSCGPHQQLDPDDLCTNCGYYSKVAVDRTWADQARRTGYMPPVSELDSYRKRIMQRQYGNAA